VCAHDAEMQLYIAQTQNLQRALLTAFAMRAEPRTKSLETRQILSLNFTSVMQHTDPLQHIYSTT